jgi:hypothetical protein
MVFVKQQNEGKMNSLSITNQYKFVFFTTLSLCIICAFPFLNAQEVVKTEDVVIEGVGTSPEAAKRNAFRNAVSKVVGSFIENDILIKNDKIIEDKLLEYSGGFVETFEIISESKDKDGLFKVKLKAKIAQQTVVEKLRSMKIDVKSVSGSNLKAQLDTQETMKKEGGKLINSIMEEYPKLWQAKQMGEPKIANGKLVLEIEVSVDRDKYLAWTGKLCKVLEKSADSKLVRSYKKEGHANYNRPENTKLEDLHIIYDPYYFGTSSDYLIFNDRENSDIVFAVVEEFSVSGNCKLSHFLFKESNPLFSLFKVDKETDVFSNYARKFVPNRFNVMIYDSFDKLIYKYDYKSVRGSLWDFTVVDFGMNSIRGQDRTMPITPFPCLSPFESIRDGHVVYSTKCIVKAALPIEDFDVAKISKITTGFSIEK